MEIRDDSKDYRRIFVDNLPLLDVRAPVEFIQGAFPLSTNIALLNNDQRKAVGTAYKQQGQDAAIALGWTLATPRVTEQRLAAWRLHIDNNPEGYLYCFRGGLRSKLTQQLLADNGVHYPIVEGGYKAMRRYLLDNLKLASQTQSFVLVGGCTGAGKTELLSLLSDSIDLEGAANHRGSAFGAQLTPQPTQINFENTLSIELLKLGQKRPRELFLEDEGRLIGRINIPTALRNAMAHSPRVILEASLGERISRILNDYVICHYAQLVQHSEPTVAAEELKQTIISNLNKIKKRLGGLRHDKVVASFKCALEEFSRTNNTDLFRPSIQLLLTEYYDPMYQHQLSKQAGDILFSGDRKAILQWAQHRHESDANTHHKRTSASAPWP